MNRLESIAGGTASHSTRLPAEELLAGHPKDGDHVSGYRPLMWFIALLLVAFVAGCGGGGSGNTAPAVTKAITAYSLAGVTGTINETTKIIAVTVPNGINVTALAATFTTTGASVKVGATVQTSGTTANDFTSPVAYIVTAADNTTATYNVTVTVAPTSAKAITAYSLAGVAGTINETAKTISVTLPFGTSVTALAATFTTTGTSVNVGAVAQTSGTTANDFTSPVAYTVTAADSTTATYNVTVAVALSSAKAITAYSLAGVAGTVNETTKTIAVPMPYGTNVTALVATFTTTGANVKIGTTTQISGTTANDFTSPVAYTVTAADSTTATYTVTVTVALNSAKAITAYSLAGVAGTINETAKTIAVPMPYGTNVTALVATFTTTGAGVKIGSTTQISATTANDFTSQVAYIITAADNSTATYTVTVTVALNSAKAITAYSLAGVAGTINETTKTIAVPMPYGTNVTTLVATFTTTGTNVKVGTTTQQISTTTANDFTSPVAYIITAADNSTATYTVTVTVALNSAKAITAYSLAGVAGTVNETAKTIAVPMPYGTNVTALVATFTTTGTSVKVGTATQTSATTANDFTSPVAYTVTAADNSTATYNVTVTVAQNSAKAITAYSLAGVAGTINETTKTIAVPMPYGTNVTALVATFTTTGVSVTVAAAPQTSGATPNNFTSPVAYIVTAADGSTAIYSVTVTVALNSAKAITAYSLAGVAGSINETAKTIAVPMPYGTNVTALVATFTTTGASVKVGTATQISATTANDFTSPVAYIVTAADNSTATYTVTVTVAQNSAKAITVYSLAGVAGTVNETAKTIAVPMPYGTNVTALVATFTTTGTSVTVAAAPQTSTATANDFTNQVAYTVTAANNSTATYTVTVTVAQNSAKAITAYSLAGVSGTINETAKTIAVPMPYGTNVTALVATFTTTGASVTVAAAPQTSTATANDFTNQVAYTVTAANNSTATYTVTVTVALATGPQPVGLGLAGNYVVFANTGIDSSAGSSVITGDMGAGPGITSTTITGFALNLPAGSAFSTSAQVSGNIYAFDYAPPTPTNVTTASNDMGAAYTDAASRTATSAATTDVGNGTLASLTLTPGVYQWGTAVNITTDLTLNGSATDVWIFKVAGALDLVAAKSVLLSGGALPKNIFWQIAGAVTIGTTAHMEGVILSQTAITLGMGASANSRLLAQTTVTLDSNAVTQPAP